MPTTDPAPGAGGHTDARARLAPRRSVGASPPARASRADGLPARLALALALLLFAIGLLRTAWLSDDAFITLRTVENLVDGYGLRWNVAERVQTFTHPLWMFLLAGGRALGGAPDTVALALSALCSAGVLWVLVRRVARGTAGAALAVALLASSMAFVDFSTSGLEGPLTHLFVVLFAARWFAGERGRPLAALAWLAGLAACNRLDSLLLFAPALALALRDEAAHAGTHAALRRALSGFLPLAAWLAFATFYFGNPLPNTALAKAFDTGIPAGELALQGLRYLADGARRDPVLVAALVGSVLVATRGPRAGRRLRLAFLAGALLDLAYVVKVGGDFMAGRFLTAPFLIAVAVLVRWEGWERRPAAALSAGGLALVTSATLSAPGFLSPPDFRDTHIGPHGIANERGFYYRGHGLLSPERQRLVPGAFTDTLRAAGRTELLVGVRQYIGVEGLLAGPGLHIVDSLLCDPLLVRLPVARPERWRIGHFERRIPDGYLATLAGAANRIRHPGLARYYDELALVTRGELLDPGRWRAIARQLSGRNDALLAAYVETAYRSPTPVVIDAALLAPEPHPGLRWHAPPAVSFGKGGLEVGFPAGTRGERLVLGLHFGDRVELLFHSGGRRVGTLELETPPDFRRELVERSAPLPPGAREGFDRVTLRGVETFDGVLALGWLRVE